MKVIDLFKHRGDSVSSQHSEFMQWMSPALGESIGATSLNRTQNSFASSHGFVIVSHQPAVNEDAPVMPIEKPIEIKPEAQLVLNELISRSVKLFILGDWINVSQERINQFGLVTEDMQWIHTEPSKAETDSPSLKRLSHMVFWPCLFFRDWLTVLIQINLNSQQLNGCEHWS